MQHPAKSLAAVAVGGEDIACDQPAEEVPAGESAAMKTSAAHAGAASQRPCYGHLVQFCQLE